MDTIIKKKQFFFNFSKLIIKIILQLSVIISLFFAFHLTDFHAKDAFDTQSLQFNESIENTLRFSDLYNIAGWQPLIGLFVVATIFLLFWIFSFKNWYKHLPAIFRDLLVIYAFVALSISYYQNSSVFINLSIAVSIYLTVAIANFGGLLEDARETLTDLLQVAAILLVGNLISFVSGETNFGFSSNYLIDLVMVYILGFVLKLFFFPDSILTFDINKGNPKNLQIKRLFFALLSITVLFPIVGMFFAAIIYGLLGLINYFFELPKFIGAGSYSIKSVFSSVSLSGFYIINLMKQPINFITFLISLLIHLRTYANTWVNDDNKNEDYFNPPKIKTDKPLQQKMLNYLYTFPVSKNETIQTTFKIVGISSLIVNTLLIFMFVTKIDILEAIMEMLGL